MSVAPSISIDERRRRLAVRHGLAAGTTRRTATEVVTLAESLVGLHASDPATPPLAAWARIADFVVADLEDAMYETPETPDLRRPPRPPLTKHLGMRRTLFVHSSTVLAVAQAACAETLAVTERKRAVTDVERGGIAADGDAWVRRVEAATLAALAELGPSTGAELSKVVPELRAKIVYGEGTKWGGPVGIAGRIYTLLATTGRIRRGRPKGTWISSQHRWALDDGFPDPLDPTAAQRCLVERWLRAFGPATVADIAWWTGIGLTKVRAALAALAVAEVELDGTPGVVLADDLAPTPTPGPWVALLPSLDPTTMGWKERDWYLGDHRPRLYDVNGNAGPSIWSDGRIVGGWSQRRTGEVVTRLLDDIGAEAAAAEAAAAVDAEAAALTEWLAPVVVTTRFPTPLDKELRA